MEPVGRFGHVILGVESLDEALAFFQGVLGLALKFRDGDRYAALDAGGVTLALAAGAEAPPGGHAISFKVEDLVATERRLREAGATVVAGPEEGPHERRLTLESGGHTVVVYAVKG